MQALRTPEARFDALPGYGFAPHYLDGRAGHAGLRVHYLDEGPRDAAVTALCLHGNPSWSYLWRQMIPVFTAAGLRVVAPDLIGFGRSDKPVDEAVHSVDFHRRLLVDVIERLQLRNLMLVCQDWGGILGLTLPLALPDRFTRLLVMNTTLATGEVTEGFRQWRAYSNANPDLAVGKLMARGKRDLTPAEAAAYDAPFPDARHKAALRAFPNLVPDGAHAPGAAIGREAAAFWRERWAGDSFMAIGEADPVLGGDAMRALHATIRGCPPPLSLPEAGHFVPEWGAPIAAAALRQFGLA
ncbi:MAG: alpha/beta fold hydrolase [Burkholderiales bacterium]|nr:alpha/beta fold hydrolase [Burkholderiales bacterium]MDE2277177.1 alpha/beta fold hydrolase [Burkholderiales bacterium]